MNPPFSPQLTTLPSQPLFTSCPLTPPSSHTALEKTFHQLRGVLLATTNMLSAEIALVFTHRATVYLVHQTTHTPAPRLRNSTTKFVLECYFLYLHVSASIPLFTCWCKAENNRDHPASIIRPPAPRRSH